MQTINRRESENVTGVKNEHYDLISVAYHALEAGIRYNTYIKDAEESGDQELAEFFRHLKQQTCDDAQKAQQLLAKRMG